MDWWVNGRGKEDERRKAFSNVSTRSVEAEGATLYAFISSRRACRRRTHNTCLHSACIGPSRIPHPQHRREIFVEILSMNEEGRKKKKKKKKESWFLFRWFEIWRMPIKERKKDGKDERGEGGDKRGWKNGENENRKTRRIPYTIRIYKPRETFRMHIRVERWPTVDFRRGRELTFALPLCANSHKDSLSLSLSSSLLYPLPRQPLPNTASDYCALCFLREF